jgi:phosphoesterase RecJ-like protein
MSQLAEVVERLNSSHKFVITTHMSSDGDGIGSQLALARGLKSLGKEVALVNPTKVPENLRFLLRHPQEIVTPRDVASPEELFRSAWTVVVDMGAFERLGAVLPFSRQSEGLVVVDHHRLDQERGVVYLVDEGACATGEIVRKILAQLKVALTLEIAEPLYAAVLTDTGSFRYPSTTPRTHELAAELLAAGVEPQRVYSEIFERQSATRMKLTGAILSTLRLSPGGKVAWMEVRHEMIRRLGARMEDADDLVNFTVQIDGVVAGFFFKELGKRATKVSCRSRGEFPIDRFVSQWGGGGHLNAAGVRLDMAIDEAEELLIHESVKALESDGADR